MNASEIKKRLEELNFDVSDPPAPVANYVPVVQSGNLAFVSGQVSMAGPDNQLKGRLGENASLEEGVVAARVCGANILLQLAKHMEQNGSRVGRCVKLGGFVNSTPDFGDHPLVINGCSDLMVDVLGDQGRHARFALGVANLPFGFMVEIDAVFELN